jgi:ammonium transporter Rh
VACVAIQLHPLFHTLWAGIFNGSYTLVNLNVSQLILGDFAAGAVLISFGALIGKISPSQLVLLAIFETFFYSINERLAFYLHITDIGGSMVIHTFGAFFGLAASRILSDTKKSHGHVDNAAVYHSDLFAMIGTIFLWLYWPSFNAAMTSSTASFTRAVVNTVMSLTGSCITAFYFSFIFRGHKKFNMVFFKKIMIIRWISRMLL